MISSNNFIYKKQLNNKKITIKFKAESMNDNYIYFYVFRKRLFTKIKINLSKLFDGLKFIYEKKINKNINPQIILSDLEKILINFNDFKISKKKEKLCELLEYIVINREYFKKSEYILNILDKKLIKLYYTNNDLKIIKYYYFLIFKLNDIIIDNTNLKKAVIIELFKNYDDDLDYFLDNLESPIKNIEIAYDLNFF